MNQAPTPTPPDDDMDAISLVLCRESYGKDRNGISHAPNLIEPEEVQRWYPEADAILADLKRRGRLRDADERTTIAEQRQAAKQRAAERKAAQNDPAPAADGVTAREIDAFCSGAKVALLGWNGHPNPSSGQPQYVLSRGQIADGITAALAARK